MVELAELSLREKAAQLVFPRLGSNMPPPTTVAEDLERFQNDVLDRCPVGGLVLFNGRLPDSRSALSDLQRRSRVPLLVSTDMERGVGQQIRGATTFPHAMAFSIAGTSSLERAARVQAREALACGLHVTFAPDADVNRDPRNPIIATRAFSGDPVRAADLVRAYVSGCRAEGLLTTAKHFPGHGNTHQDSHEEIPVVRSGREELLENDLLPFMAAIDEGVDLVMTAHVLYPALDPDHPATLSPAILRDLLRGELGFRGAVITDSLLMGAIRSSHHDVGHQAAALVKAGVDVLLDVPDPVRAAHGIEEAVENGMLEERLVDEAVDRVLALKQRFEGRFGEGVFRDPSRAVPLAEVGSDANETLARDVARASIETIDRRENALPIPHDAGNRLLGVMIKPHRSRFDPDEEPFAAELRDVFPGSVFRQIGPEANHDAYEELRELTARAEYIVVAMVIKPAAWHSFGLRPEQASFVSDTVARYKTVVVSLGSPYVLDKYERADARICTYSDVDVSQRAAVHHLADGHG